MRISLTTYKVIYYIIGAIYFVLGYVFLNHNPLFEPKEIFIFNIENKIPVLPFSIVIYISTYLVMMFVIIFTKSKENLISIFKGFMILSTIHYLIFLIFPTTYPRNLTVFDFDSVFSSLFHTMHTVDPPNNCFPSMHVSSAFFGAFCMKKLFKRYFPFFLVWAILVSISTLTTKQHYLLDIISGFSLAYLCYYKFVRISNKNITLKKSYI